MNLLTTINVQGQPIGHHTKYNHNSYKLKSTTIHIMETENSNILTPPTTPNRSTFSCKICGDHTTGKFYGAISCSGCRGFFRRTVVSRAKYACQFDKHCKIDKHGRTRCKYCRYKKCLAVGMNPDEVIITP